MLKYITDNEFLKDITYISTKFYGICYIQQLPSSQNWATYNFAKTCGTIKIKSMI